MKLVQIPYTDLHVWPVCLGTATFGSEISVEESVRIMDCYAAAGGNFLDTARVYADWLPGGHGASETTIGKWLRAHGNRSGVVLSTKGAHPDLRTMNVSRMSKADIAADINESLQCLQTDYVDLYWLHRDDTTIPVAEILGMMEEFVKGGKIRYYGCSNWRAPRIREAIDCAKRDSVRGFVADQPLWSLAEWNAGSIGDATLVAMSQELFELHKATGLAAVCYSSQAKGFFSKFAQSGERLSASMRRRFWNEVNLRRAEKVVRLADELKVPVAAIPLAWLMAQPFLTIPIIGPRNTAQLEESLTAADVVLPPEIVEAL